MLIKTISVRNVPEDLWQWVRVEAAKTGKTASDILIEALKLLRVGKDGRK